MDPFLEQAVGLGDRLPGPNDPQTVLRNLRYNSVPSTIASSHAHLSP